MYAREITEASKSALLELYLGLSRYRDDFVLTGGWAPYFISSPYFPHCGSVDIDLALKCEVVPRDASIRDTLIDLGYIEVSPFRCMKKAHSWIDGKEYEICLDLLCNKDDSTDQQNLYHHVQSDLRACTFRGVDIAFDFNFEQEIQTRLPDGKVAIANIKVADIVGSFTMKGQAIIGRSVREPKDFYDVFSLTFFGGDPVSAARLFDQAIQRKKRSGRLMGFIDDSFAIIQGAFSSPDSYGSFEVERFSPEYNRFIAHARMKQFLDELQSIWEGRSQRI